MFMSFCNRSERDHIIPNLKCLLFLCIVDLKKISPYAYVKVRDLNAIFHEMKNVLTNMHISSF